MEQRTAFDVAIERRFTLAGSAFIKQLTGKSGQPLADAFVFVRDCLAIAKLAAEDSLGGDVTPATVIETYKLVMERFDKASPVAVDFAPELHGAHHFMTQEEFLNTLDEKGRKAAEEYMAAWARFTLVFSEQMGN